MADEATVESGEPLGTGWRAASWLAFGAASVLAYEVLTADSRDMIHAVMLTGGILLAMLGAVLGLVFSVFSIAASESKEDRRLVVILPMVANAGLLLLVVATVFAS
jgi:uncharacterized membrane protein